MAAIDQLGRSQMVSGSSQNRRPAIRRGGKVSSADISPSRFTSMLYVDRRLEKTGNIRRRDHGSHE